MTVWIITILSSKRAASSTMAAILKDDHFAALLAYDGGDDDQDAVLKETQSMSKFVAQYAQNKECSHDTLDNRLRWVNQQIQDQYVQGTTPYDNEHVVECLCKGGAISYQVKKEWSQHQWWMDRYYVQFVVPNIARKYSSSSKVALVLGHAQQKIPGSVKKWKVPGIKYMTVLKRVQIKYVRT